MPDGLGDKVAIVSGATSGIGTTIARRLIADGAQVLLTGRSAAAGKLLRAELGDRSAFIAADLATPTAAERIVGDCVRQFGRVDVLVNNAALDHTGDLLSAPIEEVRRTFEINTFAALRLLQAAATAMTGGGAIINITSRLASIGVPTMSIYSASKGALLALTRAAAVELAPRNIRVNAVAPGMTRTPLFQSWLAAQQDPAAIERATTSAIPLGRLGCPEDVANVVAFLASERASYLTGISIAVDGGYTAQ